MPAAQSDARFQTIVRAYDELADVFGAGTATELGIAADVINRAYKLYPEDEVPGIVFFPTYELTTCFFLVLRSYFWDRTRATRTARGRKPYAYAAGARLAVRCLHSAQQEIVGAQRPTHASTRECTYPYTHAHTRERAHA